MHVCPVASEREGVRERGREGGWEGERSVSKLSSCNHDTSCKIPLESPFPLSFLKGFLLLATKRYLSMSCNPPCVLLL